MTGRYLTGVRTRRSSELELWEEILRTLAQQLDINFAYPTQRSYYNSLKGHPPAPPSRYEKDTDIPETGDEFGLR